tara:strand:- start:1272 stop:1520 length:249 start_codon:yes stop_codon:yes gene_type:complete
MNMKAQKPLAGKQQSQIDINDTETMVCDDCGNAVFIPAFFLRRLSPLMSPTGQEALIPMQVYSCGNCGKVPDKLKQEVDGES